MSISIMNAARHASRSFIRPQLTRKVPSRTFVTLQSVKYTAHATAQGAGRNGTTKSNGLELNLATPKELGGTGQGAIQLVARGMGKTEMAKNAKVHVSVHLGEPKDMEGFGIGVDIKVEGIDDELLQAGHAFCPYSRALKHGAVVNVSTA
ncbi:hypothetical protein EDD85DRAFT_429500 [Armillaria nabsnona]|nr:hypothetical protein EDD85DRAFT_429500 [Armillaria nabsnona]